MKRTAALLFAGLVGFAPAAFAADAPSPVKRDGDKVQITGVPEVQWGKTGPATLIGCLQAATSVTEHPASYDDLQAWSGVAFRIRWYRGLKDNSWHGVSPVVELPEEMNAMAKASGWRFDVKGGPATQFAKEICASIDQGVCVLGYVNKTEYDVGFIYGYEQGAKKWLVDDYYQPARTVPGSDPHDMLVFLKWTKPELTPREAMLQALRIGVENWNRGEVPAEQIASWAHDAKLCYGDSAYGQMILDIEHGKDAPMTGSFTLRHVRAWVGDNLISSRESAGRYLRKNSKLLGQPAEAHLLAAADAFEQVAHKIGSAARTSQGFTFEGAWPEDMQQREIAILKQCRALDEQAIAELQQAMEKAEE
jgi:hypothetical protein